MGSSWSWDTWPLACGKRKVPSHPQRCPRDLYSMGLFQAHTMSQIYFQLPQKSGVSHSNITKAFPLILTLSGTETIQISNSRTRMNALILPTTWMVLAATHQFSLSLNTPNERKITCPLLEAANGHLVFLTLTPNCSSCIFHHPPWFHALD